MTDLYDEVIPIIKKQVEDKRNETIQSFKPTFDTIKSYTQSSVDEIKENESLSYFLIDNNLSNSLSSTKDSISTVESILIDNVDASIQDSRANLISVNALIEDQLINEVTKTKEEVLIAEKRADMVDKTILAEYSQEQYFKQVDKDTTIVLNGIRQKIPKFDITLKDEAMASQIADYVEQLTFVNPLKLIKGDMDWLKERDEHWWQALAGMLAGGAMGSGLFNLFLQNPIMNPLQQYMNQAFPNNLMPVDDIIEIGLKRPDLLPLATFNLRLYGIDEAKSLLMMENRRRHISIEQIFTLYNRQIINRKTVEEYMRYNLMSANYFSLLEPLYKYYPSVSDIILFSVREAFEPDSELFIANGNSAPEAYYEAGRKAGISDTWLKKHWHSHWRLPAVNQVFDMFHREIIDFDDVMDYLRRLDYVSKDRNRVLALSYNLVTRVDARRLFEQGIWNEQQTYEYFRHLGYADYDASSLIALAKKIRSGDLDDLRQLFTKAYSLELLDDKLYEEFLRHTGLSDEEIAFIIDLVSYEKYLDLADETKKYQYKRLVKNLISEDEFEQSLWDLGFNRDVTSRLKAEAQVERIDSERLPTKTELDRWLKSGIISIDDWYYYMKLLGYSEEVIGWKITEMLMVMKPEKK